jgi:crotonobetainyl-CoA:carnitine CoA-transferase CaiB-like acyl-CoA transferase
MGTGMWAALGIVSALLARSSSGLPISFDGARRVPTSAAPAWGEHNHHSTLRIKT